MGLMVVGENKQGGKSQIKTDEGIKSCPFLDNYIDINSYRLYCLHIAFILKCDIICIMVEEEVKNKRWISNPTGDNVQKMPMSDAFAGEVFKSLLTLPMHEAGLKFGFDKFYDGEVKIRNAVYYVYQKVKKNPAKYDVPQDVAEAVFKTVVLRSNRSGNFREILEKEDTEKLSIKQLITGIRNKTFAIIDSKLNRLSKSKSKIDEISFKELGIIAGIAFDKAQILNGEATEHIALIAKIDPSITPEQAFEALLKTRENVAIEKNS